MFVDFLISVDFFEQHHPISLAHLAGTLHFNFFENKHFVYQSRMNPC